VKDEGGLNELLMKIQQSEEKIMRLSAAIEERDIEISDLKERCKESKYVKESLENQIEELNIHFNEQKDELIQSAKLREEDLEAGKSRMQNELEAQLAQATLKVSEAGEREKAVASDLAAARLKVQTLTVDLEALTRG
jgi:hypothetical protein